MNPKNKKTTQNYNMPIVQPSLKYVFYIFKLNNI